MKIVGFKFTQIEVFLQPYYGFNFFVFCLTPP